MISGTYWISPGIPSLLVPYGDATDFYYSGHTGIMIISVLLLRRFGFYACSWIAAAITIFMIKALILFRVHYSIGRHVTNCVLTS